MPRNTFAAFAALLCLLLGPQLHAAHTTRPSRPAPRFATSAPRVRARSQRRTAQTTTRRKTAAQAAVTRPAVTRHTKPHGTTATPVRATSATRRGATHGRASQDSFVARSAQAAAERSTKHVDAPQHPSLRDPEIQSRLHELDVTSPIPQLLPPPRTLALYDERGRLIVPAPLRGSHEVLLHQNEMADHDGLARVQDDEDLNHLRSARLLVPLPVGDTLLVDQRLPEDRRYSRPWTAVFLTAMARDFYAKFHAPLQVDSAVRTVAVQKHLVRTNGNAAPAEGETASPHLTGQAVDVAKRGLTMAQIAWMRLYLQPLMDAGQIDVEEEFRQACFHISVYRSYLPSLPAHISVAATVTRQTPAEP